VRPPDTIKSAERTLAILEFFRETKRSAGVTSISRALQLPQSSTTMLLKSLQRLGYLEYDSIARTFRPTYRVAVLGNWIQQSMFKSGPLTDIMDRIGQATGETVILGLQNGANMQYVHIVAASYAVQLASQVGSLRLMTCSALGRMLLSRKNDGEIRAIVRRNNADADSDARRVVERAFLEEIRQIRINGYAESRGKMTPGANVIGVLVPDQDTAPLAIGVGGPIERIDARRDDIIKALRLHFPAQSS
jgi:IclR family acetate operon transcriptional repressor